MSRRSDCAADKTTSPLYLRFPAPYRGGASRHSHFAVNKNYVDVLREAKVSRPFFILLANIQEWHPPLTAQFLYGWIVILVRKLHLYLFWLH